MAMRIDAPPCPGLPRTLHAGVRACPQSSPGAPPRGDADPPARQPTPQTTLRQDPWEAWHHTCGWHHPGVSTGSGVSRPAASLVRHARAGRPTQRPEGPRWRRSWYARRRAGQLTLGYPGRIANRVAPYRAAAAVPVLARWDRCVATAPAQVCPCGSARWHWGKDETTSHLHLSGSRCALVVRCGAWDVAREEVPAGPCVLGFPELRLGSWCHGRSDVNAVRTPLRTPGSSWRVIVTTSC